jgi:hypothetical protein
VTNLDRTEPNDTDHAESADLVDLQSITPDESLVADVHRTRLTTPLTRVLLALVVLSGAFLAGALVERTQHQTSNASSGLQALAAQLRGAGLGGQGATGANRGQGGAGGGGGATIGTVKLVDGNNVYVQDFSGNVTKFTVNASTTVNLTTTGKVKQLKQGSTVIVQRNQTTGDASSVASSITESSGFGGAAPFGDTSAAPGSGSGNGG